MNKMRQKLCAIDDSRSWASKIRVRIHSVHSLLTHSRKIKPTTIVYKPVRLFDHLLEIEATGSNNQNSRRPFHYVLPEDTNRILALGRKRINAACDSHHLRDPMPATIDGIQPLHTKHTRPVR